jgi:hypothetical protein
MYKSLSKGRASLCGGKGMDDLRCISRRILAAPTLLSPVSTLELSMLFLGHGISKSTKDSKGKDGKREDVASISRTPFMLLAEERSFGILL